MVPTKRERKEPIQEDVQKFLQFVLNRSSAGVREDFLRSMAEYGLYLTKSDPASVSDVLHGLSLEFPRLHVNKHLIEKSLLSSVELGRTVKFPSQRGRAHFYGLVAKTREEILEGMAANEASQEAIESRFMGLLEAKLGPMSNTMKKSMRRALHSFIANFIASRSLASLRQLVEDWDNEVHFDPAEAVPIMTAVIAGKVYGGENAEIVGEALRQLIRDTDYVRYFMSRLQAFIYFEVFQIDPTCYCLVDEFVKGGMVLLDTNVLIAALLPTHGEHDLAFAAVSQTKQLGMGVFISERTRMEFIETLEADDRFYRSAIQSGKRLGSLSFGPFVENFLAMPAKERPTWDSYYVSFSEELLERLNRIGVTVYGRNLDGLSRHADFKMFCECVFKSALFYTGSLKHEWTVEHDAMMLLLIRQERKKRMFRRYRPKCWFVTQDRTLYPAALALADDGSPLCVLTDTWLETTMLFPAAAQLPLFETIPDVLAEFLSTSFSRTMPTQPIASLREILRPMMEYEKSSITEQRKYAEETLVKDKIIAPMDSALDVFNVENEKFIASLSSIVATRRMGDLRRVRRRARVIQTLLALALFVVWDLYVMNVWGDSIQAAPVLVGLYVLMVTIELSVLASISGLAEWFGSWVRRRKR